MRIGEYDAEEYHINCTPFDTEAEYREYHEYVQAVIPHMGNPDVLLETMHYAPIVSIRNTWCENELSEQCRCNPKHRYSKGALWCDIMNMADEDLMSMEQVFNIV